MTKSAEVQDNNDKKAVNFNLKVFYISSLHWKKQRVSMGIYDLSGFEVW